MTACFDFDYANGVLTITGRSSWNSDKPALPLPDEHVAKSVAEILAANFPLVREGPRLDQRER